MDHLRSVVIGIWVDVCIFGLALSYCSGFGEYWRRSFVGEKTMKLSRICMWVALPFEFGEDLPFFKHECAPRDN